MQEVNRPFLFFFNHTATTEIYTLSLHDALPICLPALIGRCGMFALPVGIGRKEAISMAKHQDRRSEEHTSELQSQSNLVCRLLLEKKKKQHCHYPQLCQQYDPFAQIQVSHRNAI